MKRKMKEYDELKHELQQDQLIRNDKKITMSKNYTPLIKSDLASKIFNTNIFYKLENLNYTGSHKDRECKYILSKQQNRNYNSVGCASTGNLAIS